MSPLMELASWRLWAVGRSSVRSVIFVETIPIKPRRQPLRRVLPTGSGSGAKEELCVVENGRFDVLAATQLLVGREPLSSSFVIPHLPGVTGQEIGNRAYLRKGIYPVKQLEVGFHWAVELEETVRKA